MTKIYLAGPLFSLAEQGFNAELARFLESERFEGWLPHEHQPRNHSARADLEVGALRRMGEGDKFEIERASSRERVEESS